MSQYPESTLITGATSGIGWATAEVLAKRKRQLILCGRRSERLAQLQEKLSKETRVTTLMFDVAKREDVFNAISSIEPQFSNITQLVNNAGNAHGRDYFQDASLDDFEMMIDINLKGLIYVTKAILPRMIDAGVGHIINIGSIAGKEVYPQGNVYCASKFAVDALSQALRIDLNQHSIRVGAVHPGMVETEFSLVRFKNDEKLAKSIYEGLTALSAIDIANVIDFMLACPPHVNIADIVVLPTAQASATVVRRAK